MRLPFGKQIIAAAVIAVIAPSATVIGAQSFSDFISTSRTVRIAQNVVPMPPINAGDAFRGAPAPKPPAERPAVERPVVEKPLVERPEVEKPLVERPVVVERPEVEKPPIEKPPVERPAVERPTVEKPLVERPETPRADGGGSGSAAASGLEDCVKGVLGDESYAGFRKGTLLLSEEQKTVVRERCESSRSASPRKSAPTDRGEGAPNGDGSTGSGTQTCNVNGVEMPGPCSRYEGRGDDGSSDSDGSDGFNGPSDEEMERMEKERKARMLKDMKRGLRGMEQGLRMLERGLKVCTAAKIDASSASTALANIKEIIAKVKTAEDPDELQDIMADLPEQFDGARELIDVCHRLRELPRITKQLTNEVKRIERELKNATAQAKRAKMDVTEQINEITVGLNVIKETIAEVAQVKTADAFDEAMERIEGLRETFEDLQERIGALRGVLNVSRGIAEAKREIRNTERIVSALKRRKIGTSELQSLITQGKALVAEIESIAKQKPLDPDLLQEKFEELESIGSNAEEIVAKLQGKALPSTGPQFSRSPVAGAEIPDSFRQFSQKKAEPDDSSDLEALLGF